MKKTTWPGNWKVACDVCGFWFPSGEMQQRWDGLVVCHKDFETRHPGTLYNYKAHVGGPDFVRKDPIDTFVLVCDVISMQARAEYGTAGCATVGTSYPTLDLSDFKLLYPNLFTPDTGLVES